MAWQKYGQKFGGMFLTEYTEYMDQFYQRGSIASYASADSARAEMSVCLSV